MLLKLLLAGDGGQGIQLIADVITNTAFEFGYEVSMIPNYGLEQRGGVSLAFIQISKEKIAYPKFVLPDLVLILSNQARERMKLLNLQNALIIDVNDFKDKLVNVEQKRWNIYFLKKIGDFLEKEKLLTNEQIFQFLKKKLGKYLDWEDNVKVFCNL